MVYLIGAGPGNPGFISCLGMEILKKCDAVIYDRLGTTELLDEVSEDCEKVYVGKKPGCHYRKQDEINQIILEMARKHKLVVRLKGGDPFVFGRGGEEVKVLKENNIDFRIIPGITSAISVPEITGIPVTHRSAARSFHVFTGHTAEDSDVYSHIHREDGTSVFLMGLAHIDRIVDRLMADGEKPEKPVSVIAGGTLPGQKKVTGTLADIVEKVRKEKLVSPAIIVVGETAAYDFISEGSGALWGKQIGVTGTKLFRKKLRWELELKGAELFSVCNMELIASDEKNLKKELESIEEYAWVGFTSQNSIRIFFDMVKKYGIDMRRFANVKFAVVGTGTGNMLREEGFNADYMPENYTTKDMAEGLVKKVNKGEKILFPRAVRGSKELPEILEQNGVDYKIVNIYDIRGTKTENWEYIHDLDALVFASASGVREFAREIGKDVSISEWNRVRKERGVRIAAIGRLTADTLRNLGLEVDIVPEKYDIENLVKALEMYSWYLESPSTRDSESIFEEYGGWK